MKKSVIVILHIGYWVLYVLLIGLVVACLQLGASISTQPAFTSSKFILFMVVFAIVPAVIGFYGYYTILFATYLSRKKIALLFLAAIIVATIAGMVGAFLLVIMYSYHIGPGIMHDGFASAIPITIIMVFIALLNGVVAVVMKGFITWYGDIKLKEDLSKKNFEIELALVKSQIDPHFLFNTINNIDVLIQMDAIKASAYLNKLSGMMRFMLYQTKTEKIPLQQELAYIQQYVELQQIRVANANFVQVHIQGSTTNCTVHPMVFIPFIENAFKHNTDNTSNNAINIQFTIQPQCIVFTCINTSTQQANTAAAIGGLGNGLIQKRLALLYSKAHTLHIQQQGGTYQVQLTIPLYA
jgi:two-component system, LytTR family, sensor kinase